VLDAPAPTPRPHRSGQARLAALLLGGLALLAAVPQLVTRRDPEACRLEDSLRPPSWAHPFGHDLQGCDQLAQTLYGARTSLGLAVLVIAGTVAVALVLGSLAGFVGGRTDVVVSRLTDVWAGIPLVLGGVLLLSGTERRGPLELATVLVLFGWPPMVRVLRAGVVQQRGRDHVLAARALGARPLRVLLRHVLPGSVRPLVVLASAYAGVVVAAEATLTFAGVGLARPTQSWGIQLFEAQTRLAQAPHLLVPGAFVVAAVTGSVLLGEALRERPGADAL
jgi:oligopeptide transport system permease protein